MRIWSPFTFISVFAITSAVAATACDLSSTDYSDCGDSYRQYCGSSSYGGSSSGYYPTPEAPLPSTCNEAFSVAFPIQSNSGDCQLVVSRLSNSDQGSYGGSYASHTATYYFGELRSPSAYSEPCTVISGPSVGRCERLGALVVLASTTSSDSARLRSELGLDSEQATFYGQLTCKYLDTPVEKTFAFRCGPSTPATPSPGEAGAGDPGPDGGTDGGDGGDEVDASPELLH